MGSYRQTFATDRGGYAKNGWRNLKRWDAKPYILASQKRLEGQLGCQVNVRNGEGVFLDDWDVLPGIRLSAVVEGGRQNENIVQENKVISFILFSDFVRRIYIFVFLQFHGRSRRFIVYFPRSSHQQFCVCHTIGRLSGDVGSARWVIDWPAGGQRVLPVYDGVRSK